MKNRSQKFNTSKFCQLSKKNIFSETKMFYISQNKSMKKHIFILLQKQLNLQNKRSEKIYNKTSNDQDK